MERGGCGTSRGLPATVGQWDSWTDLQAHAGALVQSMTDPVGRAVQTAMFSDAGRLPEVAEAKRRISADRFRRAEPVIARAVERGGLPADTDSVKLIRTLVAPIYFRLLVSADPVEEGTAEQAVRITPAPAPWPGAQPQPQPQPSRRPKRTPVRREGGVQRRERGGPHLNVSSATRSTRQAPQPVHETGRPCAAVVEERVAIWRVQAA
ncbi:TetR-like C-terminal domain-containing protein [Streptomyces nojiriensis]|uniref:TetR-like C-terminal domain-containing protein n=1 Tax=Streptomyces nojiriensis TaxID=66374 RepID=UPI0036577079